MSDIEFCKRLLPSTLFADGDLDTSFGVNGVVTPGQFSGFDSVYDVFVQLDGKLVVAGESDLSFALAR